MALPTDEMLADPEFVRQFVDAALSDAATARTLELMSGDLWGYGATFALVRRNPETGEITREHLPLERVMVGEPERPGDDRETVRLWFTQDLTPRMPIAQFVPAGTTQQLEHVEDEFECAECGAPCDPRELFCDGCLDAGSE
jgi:hypothetical protein